MTINSTVIDVMTVPDQRISDGLDGTGDGVERFENDLLRSTLGPDRLPPWVPIYRVTSTLYGSDLTLLWLETASGVFRDWIGRVGASMKQAGNPDRACLREVAAKLGLDPDLVSGYYKVDPFSGKASDVLPGVVPMLLPGDLVEARVAIERFREDSPDDADQLLAYVEALQPPVVAAPEVWSS